MNYYSEAINALNHMNDSKDGDIKSLLFEIARCNPKAVSMAHRRIYGESDRDKLLLYSEKGHSRMDCIKFYKMLTNKSLKESIIDTVLILPKFKEKVKKLNK